MEAIVKDQKFSMREYDYKGDLDEFAGDNGYSDENAFVEKFGKDSVVKAMLVQKAQDYVIEHANIGGGKARKNLVVWAAILLCESMVALVGVNAALYRVYYGERKQTRFA
ncbi:MAG: hypothetical protein ACLR7D_02645 [Lachnospira eligens]